MRLLHSSLRHLFACLIIAAAFLATAHADGMDGTWRLVKRQLPDGSVLTPPAVYGRSTTNNGVNHLLVFWPTPDGKSASLSSMSKWEWSAAEVAVTPMVLVFDEGNGKPPLYLVGGDVKRSPLQREGGKVSYQHPLDPPFMVVEGDRSVATVKGAFVDYWEREK